MHTKWLTACAAAMLLCGVARGQVSFKPATPPSLSITIGAGEAVLPGGPR